MSDLKNTTKVKIDDYTYADIKKSTSGAIIAYINNGDIIMKIDDVQNLLDTMILIQDSK